MAAAASSRTISVISVRRSQESATSTSIGIRRVATHVAARGPGRSASTARMRPSGHAGLDWDHVDQARVGIYIGVTEHGNVETETEIHELRGYDYDTSFWSHHHNPRTVANNPAGEIALNMGIVGPHYTVGAACAAGNAGLIQGAQMLTLGECDVAIAGGVSESIHTFGIFAGFKSQGALAQHEDPTRASRPFDQNRNGIVVAEGGALVRAGALGRRRGSRRRNLRRDRRLRHEYRCHRFRACRIRSGRPNASGSRWRMLNWSPSRLTLSARMPRGRRVAIRQECAALRDVFGQSDRTFFNNTKSFIGHAMGAAGALELAGNISAFRDAVVHPTINVDDLDPDCALPGLVLNQPRETTDNQLHSEQCFWYVGDQFGPHRQETLTIAGAIASILRNT